MGIDIHVEADNPLDASQRLASDEAASVRILVRLWFGEH